MIRDPLKDIGQTTRLFEDQMKQAVEMGRSYARSMEAAQDALKNFGAIGLDQNTLAALKGFAPSPIDLTGLDRISSQVTDAVAGMSAAMARPASMFRDIGGILTKALEIPTFLRGLKLPTHEELKEAHRRLLRRAESLAKAGWTFPTTMSLAEVAEIAGPDGGLDAAALDERFVGYYAAERGREFRALASRLIKKKRVETWRPLLRECLWAYRRGKYRVVVPALLATIEGLVCEVTGTIREKGVNASKHWQRTVKPPEGFMVEVEWCATAAFLEGLWRRCEFDGPAPEGLNRHWVLHGRRPEVGGRADALRLLAAVDFIAEAARNVESLAKRLERKRRKR